MRWDGISRRQCSIGEAWLWFAQLGVVHERSCTYKQHGDVLICKGTVPFSYVQIWFLFTELPVRRHDSAGLLVRVLLKRGIVLTLQVQFTKEKCFG